MEASGAMNAIILNYLSPDLRTNLFAKIKRNSGEKCVQSQLKWLGTPWVGLLANENSSEKEK